MCKIIQCECILSKQLAWCCCTLSSFTTRSQVLSTKCIIPQPKSYLMSIFLDEVQESSMSFDMALSEQNSLSLAHWAECRCPFSHLFLFPGGSDLKRLGHYSVKVKLLLSVVVFFKKWHLAWHDFFPYSILLVYTLAFYSLCVCFVTGVDKNVKHSFSSTLTWKPYHLW